MATRHPASARRASRTRPAAAHFENVVLARRLQEVEQVVPLVALGRS